MTAARKPGVRKCPTCGRTHKRSTEQNKRLWALYTELSNKLTPGGKTYSPKQFHIYYKKRFLGCTDFRLPDGSVLPIVESTSDLDTADFAVFLEQVEADAAHRGVFLDD
jgi:hypothetical protein